jgi:hypothetical protein
MPVGRRDKHRTATVRSRTSHRTFCFGQAKTFSFCAQKLMQKFSVSAQPKTKTKSKSFWALKTKPKTKVLGPEKQIRKQYFLFSFIAGKIVIFSSLFCLSENGYRNQRFGKRFCQPEIELLGKVFVSQNWNLNLSFLL